jgi:hypothetical protein
MSFKKFAENAAPWVGLAVPGAAIALDMYGKSGGDNSTTTYDESNTDYLPNEQKRIDQLNPRAATASSNVNESLNYLRGIKAGDLTTNTAAAQSLLNEKSRAQAQRVMAYQADQGMLSSSSVSRAQAALMQEKVAAKVSLQAAEEAERRSRIMKSEQLLQQSQAAIRELPEGAVAMKTAEQLEKERKTTAGWVDPFTVIDPYKTERDKAMASQREASQLIQDFQTRKPTTEQLQTAFQQTVDDAYRQGEEALIQQARARGASDSAIEGLRANLAADRQSIMNAAQEAITTLTGPDPAAASAALNAIYTPEQINNIENHRANPFWALLGGVTGALLGGGTVEGTELGYNLGTAAGGLLGEAFAG